MIAHNQLSMADILSECETIFDEDKPAFLTLLQNTIDLDQIVPYSFVHHFYKFGVVTNGLGIIRGISFFDRSFLDAHPEIVLEKKSDSPDEDKSLADSKALLPVLESYFDKHPSFKPEVFLGDAAFDSIAIYHALFRRFHFQKAFIP